MEGDKNPGLARKIRSIRQLRKKDPKVIEKEKGLLILKGNKTNAMVSGFLGEIHQLHSKSVFYSKHHEIFPFEDFSEM